MKWTTANLKSPNHELNCNIYVGTHTGVLKKLNTGNLENPFVQRNLHDVKSLDSTSHITSLSFGNEERTEVLIGRNNNVAQIYSLRDEAYLNTIKLHTAEVRGLARHGDFLIAGFKNGKIQCLDIAKDKPEELLLISAGDNISHLRQCPIERNVVATGGEERQNNLKVFDMAAEGKQLFSSKNLPNDYLQLEVPVWDSDVGFIDSPHVLATCSRHGYVRVYDTRKQRRPVQCYAKDDDMSFTTLATRGNYIYTGTTKGTAKAFDIRRMKTFVRTYKGFTGAVTDLYLDDSGKYLASASLDRYARVHEADSGVLLYQCYVKSKATSVLIRQPLDGSGNPTEEPIVASESSKVKAIKSKPTKSNEDKEYDELFDNMQTIREKNFDESESEAESQEEETKEKVEEQDVRVGNKRKLRSTGKGGKRKG